MEKRGSDKPEAKPRFGYDFMRGLTHEEREKYYFKLFEHGPEHWEDYSDLVLYEKDKQTHVATITINNPKDKNALPHGSYPRLIHLMRQAEYDDDVKVLVFKAVGDDFGSGADAGQLGFMIGYGDGTSPEELKKPSQHRKMWFDRDLVYGPRGVDGTLLHFSKVSICAVKGYCYGVHFQLAMSADLVIAAEDTLFTHPAWRYLGPVFNAYTLVETIGRRAAMELLMTGGPFTAERAYQLGMVNSVVPKERLDEEVAEFVAAISARSLDGIVVGKAMMEMFSESRGMSHGAMVGWIGHPWMTNQKLQEGDMNFTKDRRDKGLSRTLDDVDLRVPPRFRLSRSRRRRKE